MLTHRALAADLDQLLQVDSPPVITPDDVVLGLLPMFHIYGLNCVLSLVGAGRRHGRAGRGVRPGGLLGRHRRPRRHQPAGRAAGHLGAGSVSTVCAEAFAGVRLVVSGASALDPELARGVPRAVGPPDRAGLRPHRDLARAHDDHRRRPRARRAAARRLGRPSAARRRHRPARLPGPAGRPRRPGPDLGARCEPLLRLLARRLRRPRRRRLVGHRRHRPARRRRATSSSSTGCRRRSTSRASTSTPPRSRRRSSTRRASSRSP